MRDEIYRGKNGNFNRDFVSFCLYDKLFYDSTICYYLSESRESLVFVFLQKNKYSSW